jgi:hypothetical protein
MLQSRAYVYVDILSRSMVRLLCYSPGLMFTVTIVFANANFLHLFACIWVYNLATASGLLSVKSKSISTS